MKKKGFTLLEIMITIGIVLILMTIGYPYMKTSIENSRLQEAAWQLVNDLRATSQLARLRQQTLKLGLVDSSDPTTYYCEKKEGVFIEGMTSPTPDVHFKKIPYNIFIKTFPASNFISFDKYGSSSDETRITLESQTGKQIYVILGLLGNATATFKP